MEALYEKMAQMLGKAKEPMETAKVNGQEVILRGQVAVMISEDRAHVVAVSDDYMSRSCMLYNILEVLLTYAPGFDGWIAFDIPDYDGRRRGTCTKAYLTVRGFCSGRRRRIRFEECAVVGPTERMMDCCYTALRVRALSNVYRKSCTDSARNEICGRLDAFLKDPGIDDGYKQQVLELISGLLSLPYGRK